MGISHRTSVLFVCVKEWWTHPIPKGNKGRFCGANYHVSQSYCRQHMLHVDRANQLAMVLKLWWRVCLSPLLLPLLSYCQFCLILWHHPKLVTMPWCVTRLWQRAGSLRQGAPDWWECVWTCQVWVGEGWTGTEIHKHGKSCEQSSVSQGWATTVRGPL